MEPQERLTLVLRLKTKRKVGDIDPVNPALRALVENHATDEHSLIKDVAAPPAIDVDDSQDSEEEKDCEKGKAKKQVVHRVSNSLGNISCLVVCARVNTNHVKSDPINITPEQRVQEFPMQSFSVHLGKFWCRCCSKELALKKSSILTHIGLRAGSLKPVENYNEVEPVKRFRESKKRGVETQSLQKLLDCQSKASGSASTSSIFTWRPWNWRCNLLVALCQQCCWNSFG